jgi:hypothetical protein
MMAGRRLGPPSRGLLRRPKQRAPEAPSPPRTRGTVGSSGDPAHLRRHSRLRGLLSAPDRQHVAVDQ